MKHILAFIVITPFVLCVVACGNETRVTDNAVRSWNIAKAPLLIEYWKNITAERLKSKM